MTIRVFLENTDNFTLVNNNVSVSSAAGGTQRVVMAAGVTGLAADANVERIDLSGNLADYRLVAIAGVGFQIQDASGTVITTMPSLNQATTIAFANGSAVLAQTGGNAFTLGGVAVSTTTATAVVATLNATDVSTSAAATTVVNTTGQTFTLTSGSDIGTAFTGGAGSDTFLAGVILNGQATLTDTLQNVDALNGGNGTDTLTVTLNGGLVVTPSLTSVENVSLRVTAAASALDLIGSTGVTSVTIENSNVASTAAAGTVDNVGAAALAVKNQKTAVSFNNSTAVALALTVDTVGTVSATAPVAVTVDLGKTVASKATTLNITANASNVEILDTKGTSVATTATIAATGANTIKLTDGVSTVTTLTVTGAGSVDFTATGFSSALKTLTVADGGIKVVGTDATATNLTAVTGAGVDTLTFNGANIKSISTGAGKDSVTVATATLAATAVIDLGLGDDALTFGFVPVTGATLTGGDGTDTIGFIIADYAAVAKFTAPNLAKITAFEVLKATDVLVDTTSIDVSKITGIVSFEAGDGVTTAKAASAINLGAASTVTLSGTVANNGALTVSLKTDTAADSMTLVLNAGYTDNNDTVIDAKAASQTVIAADIETLTINSTGKMTAIVPVTGYKADLVTNTLTLASSNKLVSVSVIGDQALNLSSTAAMTKLATIDGSANTGGVTFDGTLADMTTPTTSASMTIKGSLTAANAMTGTGNVDTITGGAKADTITGGLGGDALNGGLGNDTFIYTAAAQSTLANMDVITGFVANTYGNGTSGAAGTFANATTTTWTGDVLKFTVLTAVSTAALSKISVQTNAADAQTYLQNIAADATASEFAAVLDSSTGRLYVDLNADGIIDSVIALTGVTTITAAAFVIV